MSFEADLRTYLLADSTISNLIGTRMYPVVLPQSPTYPAVSYSTISAQRGHNMQAPDGLAAQRIQVDAWALTYAQARSLSDAIRNRIDSFRGSMGSTKVQGIFFDTERHLNEQDGSTVFYRIETDYIAWHED